MLKAFGIIAATVIIILPLAMLIAGQLNLFSGTRPAGLGAKNGMLEPPRAAMWNSVSSQAASHPHTHYHLIAPLSFQGDGRQAFARLLSVIRADNATTIVTTEPGYLHAEYTTKWLRFVDDVEFLLDEEAGVIHMRSASRLGRKDFGTNRSRLESIRHKFSH